MTDAGLNELFKLVGPIVFEVPKQEINLLVGVDEEVQKLQDRFGFIKAMLDDAEERHAVKQRTEKLWLEQLQNQYYEMDDILDTWNTARIRAEIEKEEGKPADTNALAVVKKKVCSFFLMLFSCCFDLPLRHDVGHMIRKLNEKLDMIDKIKATSGIDFNRQPDVVGRPTTTSFVDVSEIIGRDIYRDELLRNLLGVGGLEERNSFCVISLVGMGGIGKTTLAQLAFNHPDVQAHFPKRMWICVSDPFNECRVAKAIINKIDPSHEHGPLNDRDLEDLLPIIRDLIKEKKYFLVLDDVWTEDSRKWEPFKVALNNGVHGSRILVTTRKHEVAKVMGSVQPIDLVVLSDEDCWSIFSKIAFSNEEQLRYLEDIGRQLAYKCKGLPLAAKTLGSLMQNKTSRKQWSEILGSHMWEFEDIEKGLLAPLLLSYYELPSTMRRCFSSCAVFPKDHLFFRDELVHHWMAQGYMELEVIAEEYFEKLAMRSFFQDFEKDKDNNDKIIGCKMHDIVHDFAQCMTKNEIFEIDGDKKLEKDCQSARHLHLKISKERQCHESIYRAKNLRTLYLLSCERDYEFEVLLSNSFNHFKCLRTLIFHCPIKKLPDAVENLIHLRCLHLSENVKIVELPETFCNLCNLQTWNIRCCGSFMKLPQGMSKLINLRHLLFPDFFIGSNLVFPKGIGKLIGLRTLSKFNISDEDDREGCEGCKLGELKNLNQLWGTLRITGMEKVDENQNAQLEKKTYLRGLELRFGDPDLSRYGVCESSWEEHLNEGRRMEKEESRKESDVKALNALKPPPNLECLEIVYYMGNTIYPNWMSSWTTLKKFHLSRCKYLECLPSLGQLPFLEELVLYLLHNVKKVGDEFLGIEDSKNKIFPNLKSLKFLWLTDWEEWIGMGGTGEEEEENDNGIVRNPIIMPCLQSLKIQNCYKLKSLPDYLLAATSLKELQISNSKVLEERYQRWTGENWHEISRISNIKLGRWYVQRDGEPQSYSERRGTLTINEMENVGTLLALDLSFETVDLSEMENDVKVLNALELPPTLQHLRIRGYMGNTIYPNRMMSLTTLKKLQLRECGNLEHLPSLGQLPLLEVLLTAWLHNVKKVGGEFLGIEDVDVIFPMLKSLEFGGLNNWEEWIGMGGKGENPKIMPRLQSLTIDICPKLKSLPDYLLAATSLKELQISNSELLEERYQRWTGENWHDISRISNIKLGRCYVQRDGEPESYSEKYYGEEDVPEISEEDDVVEGDL